MRSSASLFSIALVDQLEVLNESVEARHFLVHVCVNFIVFSLEGLPHVFLTVTNGKKRKINTSQVKICPSKIEDVHFWAALSFVWKTDALAPVRRARARITFILI